MDKLENIFKMQKELDDFIKKGRNLDYPLSEWLQRKAIALNVEMSEVMDEVNYKWWKNNKDIDCQKVKEELVDVFHFFVSMCLDVGMTGDELHKLYLEKNEKNFSRQKGKFGEDYKQ
ncbi:MAG: dUTPase [Firmicutes bacterium]|nr:dUTPase [Bacillota bacterium]